MNAYNLNKKDTLPKSGTPRGTSTSQNIKVDRDASIVACGLLNHIIAAGVHPRDWGMYMEHAMKVHRFGTRIGMGIATTIPYWEEIE